MERERTNPHSMSVMERIEASIRNYILLKVRDPIPAALPTSAASSVSTAEHVTTGARGGVLRRRYCRA